MDVEKLKQKILDLAIRGKLVPQDPNDEPASVLIEKIRAEKEKLVKEGKIKPSKEESYIYKGTDNCYYEKIGNNVINISDQIPFEIPENWVWIRLNNLSLDIKAGGDCPEKYSKKKTNELTIPIYSNGIENDGLYGYTDTPKIFKQSVTVSARGTIGFACVRFTPYVPIVRLISIIPSFYISLEYLALFINASNEKGSGTSTLQLTVPSIKPKLIAIPPYNEQVRIISLIKKLDFSLKNIGANLIEINELINITKTKILEQVFGPESSYKSYYKNYSTTIGESIEFERGSSPRPIKSFIANDGVNWIKISDGKSDNIFIDSTSEKITLAGAKKSRAVFAGDLILSNSMSYGKPYILKIDGFIHDGWFVFRNNDTITMKYLYYFLLSNYAQNQIKSFARGSTVSNISSDLMKKISITIYEIPIQDKIVKEIEEKYKIIDIIKEQLI